MTLIKSVGTRILGLFLADTQAGACVPTHGQYCFCSLHHKYYRNCYGVCTYSSNAC